MELLNTLGWLGGILLAFCALPEVVSTFMTKKCGLTWGFLLSWYVGEWLTAIPVFLLIKSPFLMFNYGLNIILITYLIYVKIKQNKTRENNEEVN